MGLSLDEMDALPARRVAGTVSFTHVAIVEDEETGIIERKPLHFTLGHTGTLEISHREDQDFRKGAVGTE